ncbi:MAG: nucleotidyltransferase family protein [Pseudomonadota bacterium]
MKVMLLAAGKGTRMLPLTAATPKPLLKVGGLSLIEHQILKLKATGFVDFVINHAWLGMQIEQALGDGSRYGVRIAWSREEEPLETAGGIVQALPLLGAEPFLIVNADIWTDFPFAELKTALPAGGLAHLVLVPNPSHHPRGDFVLHADRQLALPAPPNDSTFTYSGIAVYHPSLFANVSERKYPLLPLLKQAIAENKATAQVHRGQWLDIGTPERLQELDSQLANASS